MTQKISILNFKPSSDSSDESSSSLDLSGNGINSDDSSDSLFSDSSDSENKVKKEKPAKKETKEKKNPKEKIKSDDNNGFGLLKFGGTNNLKAALGFDSDEEEEQSDDEDDDGLPIFFTLKEKSKKNKKKSKGSKNVKSEKTAESEEPAPSPDDHPEETPNPEETPKKLSSELENPSNQDAEQPAEELPEQEKAEEKSEGSDDEEESEDIFMGQAFKKAESFGDNNMAQTEVAMDDVADDLFDSLPDSDSDDVATFTDYNRAMPLGLAAVAARKSRENEPQETEKKNEASGDYGSYDSTSPQTTSSDQHPNKQQEVIPEIEQVEQQPYLMPAFNFQQALQSTVVEDYNQPRVTNWLQFQLPEIPDFDGSVYDQKLVAEYSSEALLAYAKQ